MAFGKPHTYNANALKLKHEIEREGERDRKTEKRSFSFANICHIIFIFHVCFDAFIISKDFIQLNFL